MAGHWLWRGIATVIAISFLVNAVQMIATPAGWYESVPGVPGTGPLNTHFVIDIGLAYLVSATALAYAAARPAEAFLFTAFSAAWPTLHGLFHVVEWLEHGLPHDSEILATEFFGTMVLPAIAIALALTARPTLRALRT
ncbi:MAG: hypothetical protein GC199_11665 [Alphaproteobacteria bacterium]|nr:hypothetical protein [Alphaproteobacteria bacterium]